MRSLACLALTLLCLPITARAQDTVTATSAADVYQIASVNSLIVAQRQMPGISIGSLEKHNNHLGDAAAIAIIKIFPVSALASPENVRVYLPVIAAAFEYPKLILRPEDRQPYATFLLLDYLHRNLRDENLSNQVNQLELSLVPLLHGSLTGDVPTLEAIAAPQLAEDAPFVLKVEPHAASVRAGGNVNLDVTLTNVSKDPITARQSIRPDQSEWDYDVEVRDAKGDPAELTSYGRNRRQIVKLFENHIRTLDPGQSLVGQIILSKLFDLTVPGTYSVQVSRHLHDRESEPVVKSNTATITVTPF